MHRFQRLLVAAASRPDPRGQSLVEYGLTLSLIAVLSIGALMFLGPTVAGFFSNVALNLAGA